MTSTAIALFIGSQAAPATSFDDLEKLKYEAFTSLRSFRGRYEMVTINADGSTVRQDMVYQMGLNGRQMLILVDGKPAVEFGWNEGQSWKVDYSARTYAVTNKKDALAVPKFQRLSPPVGNVSFVMGEAGVRFGLEPPPDLEAPVDEPVDDKAAYKYTVSQKDAKSGSEVRITKWVEKGRALVRRFELVARSKGELRFVVRGGLADDDVRAVIHLSVGQLPLESLRNFRRLGSS